VNEALIVIKCPDDLKLSVILPYLEDLPLTFLFNYRVNNIDGNWLDFSRLLIEHFEPFNRKQLARNELRALRAEGDFEKFKLKFFSLLNIVDDITTESSKIDTFVNCLRRGTAYEVQKSLPKTLDDAVRLATIYEQSRAHFRFELNTHAPSIKKLNKISLGGGNKARKIKRYHEKKHKVRSSACYNCGEEKYENNIGRLLCGKFDIIFYFFYRKFPFISSYSFTVYKIDPKRFSPPNSSRTNSWKSSS